MQTRAQETVDIKRYFFIVYRYKWMILCLTIIIMAFTALITYLIRPDYKSSVKILVAGKVNLERTYAMDVPTYQEMPAYKKKEITKTQAEIALSWPNLEEVVKRLELYKLKRKLNPRESFYIYVDRILKFLARALFEIKRFFVKLIWGQVIEWEEAPPDPIRAATRELRENVSDEWVQDSDVFSIIVLHWDPVWAARIANTLADVYIENSLDSRRLKSELSYYPFVKELDEVSEKLTQISRRIEEFKRRTRIAKLDTELESKIHSLAVLQSSYYDLLRSYEFKLTDTDMERAAIQEKYGPKHPATLTSQAKVEKLKRRIQLAQELESKRPEEIHALSKEDRELLEELGPLLTKIKDIEADIQKLAGSEFELAGLYRDWEINNEIYKLLSKKKAEAFIAKADKFEELRVLERARVPLEKNSPRLDVNYGTGFVVSLIVGVFLAFFLDYIRENAQSPEEIERYLGVEVLSAIPRR